MGLFMNTPNSPEFVSGSTVARVMAGSGVAASL